MGDSGGLAMDGDTIISRTSLRDCWGGDSDTSAGGQVNDLVVVKDDDLPALGLVGGSFG